MRGERGIFVPYGECLDLTQRCVNCGILLGTGAGIRLKWDIEIGPEEDVGLSRRRGFCFGGAMLAIALATVLMILIYLVVGPAPQVVPALLPALVAWACIGAFLGYRYGKKRDEKARGGPFGESVALGRLIFAVCSECKSEYGTSLLRPVCVHTGLKGIVASAVGLVAGLFLAACGRPSGEDAVVFYFGLITAVISGFFLFGLVCERKDPAIAAFPLVLMGKSGRGFYLRIRNPQVASTVRETMGDVYDRSTVSS